MHAMRRGCRQREWLPLIIGFLLAEITGSLPVHTRHGIVFDAGSSGSRIHVYTWRTGGTLGEFDLVEDALLKTKPGLSSFAKDTGAAGASLAALLQFAEEKVPAEQRPRTPVFLMASAGLRMLPEDTSKAILSSVADTLAASPFFFKREWAYIMSGRDEGLFGWVAVNYLLGALQQGNSPPDSSGVIDLGGGSVQFAYATDRSTVLPEAHASEVQFAGQSHNIYLSTYADYGLDRARERVAASLVRADGTSEHPCLPGGHTASLSIGQGQKHAFVGSAVAAESFDSCEGLFINLFDKTTCDIPPCSFAGVHQPALPTNIFGFSYLYDRTGGIGLLDGDVQEFGVRNMTIDGIREAGRHLCKTEAKSLEARFRPAEDADKWANFCGDVAYLTALLQHGFGVDPTSVLTLGNKVAGVELVWTLGAMIAKSAALSKLWSGASGATSQEL
eukprot:TRINITY_DN92883_c0_g1_i1.p1 TRINITY_DN92883_c0_g1~~TRINITY_DN92883_c0_g1_i1.p1  ORF type:complete len:446 (-),score=70.22 TRINITY_DN92883_c0_g1_i1:32-1369(-)